MKKNMYAKAVLGIAIGILLLSILFLYRVDRKVGNAKRGYLDLSRQDFSREIISLDGEWEFCPNGYYKELTQHRSYIQVPKSWNSLENKNLKMKRYGYGTYRITLNLPHTGNYILYVPFISCCYRLMVNEKMVASEGRLGKNREDEISIWKPRNILFTTNSTRVELVLWVSNYSSRAGGIIDSILIGNYENVTYDTIYQVCRSAIFMGMFLGLGLYLLLLYIPGEQYRKSLYLGIFCMCCFVLEGYIGSYVIRLLIGGMRFETLLRIENVVLFGALVSIVLLIQDSFPLGRYHILFEGIRFIDFTYILLNIVVSGQFIRTVASVNQSLMFINFIYGLITLMHAIIRKEQYALLSFGSILVICIGSIMDTLNLANKPYAFIKSGYHLIGLILFLLCQMYILSRENVEVYKSSNQAKEMEIAFLQAQIAPHFFFNTMNNIYCVIDEDVEKAKQLILDFCTFLRVKHKFDYRKNVMYSLREELDLISSYIKIENARYHDLIYLELKVKEEFMELKIPQLILQPLVENAIKHGFKEKEIRIGVCCEKKGNIIEISVQDNGMGMEKSYTENLLSEKSLSDGVGLKNINYRLNKCFHTRLCITSEPGKGTRVWIQVPVRPEEKIRTRRGLK